MTETGCAGLRRAVLGLLLSYAGVRVVEELGCWLERLGGDQGVGTGAAAGQQLRPSARIAVGAPAAAEGGSRLHTGYHAQGHVQGRGAAGAAPGEKSWRGGATIAAGEEAGCGLRLGCGTFWSLRCQDEGGVADARGVDGADHDVRDPL
eukprot:COSAG01_NODE_994_length_12252_cov_10.271044_5_plen_149_part_00